MNGWKYINTAPNHKEVLVKLVDGTITGGMRDNDSIHNKPFFMPVGVDCTVPWQSESLEVDFTELVIGWRDIPEDW